MPASRSLRSHSGRVRARPRCGLVAPRMPDGREVEQCVRVLCRKALIGQLGRLHRATARPRKVAAAGGAACERDVGEPAERSYRIPVRPRHPGLSGKAPRADSSPSCPPAETDREQVQKDKGARPRLGIGRQLGQHRRASIGRPPVQVTPRTVAPMRCDSVDPEPAISKRDERPATTGHIAEGWHGARQCCPERDGTHPSRHRPEASPDSAALSNFSTASRGCRAARRPRSNQREGRMGQDDLFGKLPKPAVPGAIRPLRR